MRLCAYAYLYTGESIAVCVQNYALYPVMTAVTAFSAYPCSADIKRNIIVHHKYILRGYLIEAHSLAYRLAAVVHKG